MCVRENEIQSLILCRSELEYFRRYEISGVNLINAVTFNTSQLRKDIDGEGTKKKKQWKRGRKRTRVKEEAEKRHKRE